MVNKQRQPSSPLAALNVFTPSIRWHSVLIYCLYVLALLCLWRWFYLFSHWLDLRLVQQVGILFPWQQTLLIATMIFVISQLRIAIRQRAANNLSQLFYGLYFRELNDRRWALIRTKPMTAWQDVAFRHLPAFEQYLLDYKIQQRLVSTIPIFVLLLVFPLSWLAAIILFLTLPLIPLFMWLVGHGTAAAQKKHLIALNKLGAFFSDRIQGAVTVRLLNQQERQLDVFTRVGEQQKRRLADVFRLAFLSASVLDFFATVALALVAVYVGFSLLGEIPFGYWGRPAELHHGLFILLIAPSFFAELKKLGKLYHVKAEATASAQLWRHTLDQPPQSITEKNPLPFKQLTIVDGKILGFDQVLLISSSKLHIECGQRILFTGASGAGKTVLLDALAGLRALQAQQILLNHQHASALVGLRNQVFYLGQRPVFFEGTIADNLGLQQHADIDIHSAIARVGMASWLAEQPKGIHTTWQEHTPLSGGQRQRLALVRLILFKRPIVLLDEPFAHLSADERSDLLPLLFALTEHRASIWVSHHPLPMNHFHQHWHIQDGQVVQVLDEK